MLTEQEQRRLSKLYRATKLEFWDKVEHRWRTLRGSSEPVMVISAYNPWSKRLTPKENVHRDQRLQEDLRAYNVPAQRVRASSPGGGWVEEGWVMPYHQGACMKLIQKYEQHAAFILVGNDRCVMWCSGRMEDVT